MLKNAPENSAEKSSDTLICESCGAPFDCGANAGECWCFKVEMPPKALANLRERYENCLCAECLPKISAKNEVEK